MKKVIEKIKSLAKDKNTVFMISESYAGAYLDRSAIIKHLSSELNIYGEDLKVFEWFMSTTREEREELKRLSKIDYHKKELERLTSEL